MYARRPESRCWQNFCTSFKSPLPQASKNARADSSGDIFSYLCVVREPLGLLVPNRVFGELQGEDGRIDGLIVLTRSTFRI